MRYFAEVEGEKKAVEIEEREGGYRISLNGRWIDVDTALVGDGLYLSLLAEGASHTVELSRGGGEGRWIARVHGQYLDVFVRNELEERAAARREKALAAGHLVLRSPMPGLVIQIAVSEGDEVKSGDPVAVVEAMKMQNELIAERGGKVAKVHVSEGDRVEARAPIVTIEIPGEGA